MYSLAMTNRKIPSILLGLGETWLDKIDIKVLTAALLKMKAADPASVSAQNHC